MQTTSARKTNNEIRRHEERERRGGTKIPTNYNPGGNGGASGCWGPSQKLESRGGRETTRASRPVEDQTEGTQGL